MLLEYGTHKCVGTEKFVKIIEENIIPGNEDQFAMHSERFVTHFGLPYDYESVMHYSDLAWSKNPWGNLKTIITSDPTKQDVIGQRVGVSKGDIDLVREIQMWWRM